MKDIRLRKRENRKIHQKNKSIKFVYDCVDNWVDDIIIEKEIIKNFKQII